MKKYCITLICLITFSFSCYAQKEININLQKSEVHWTGSKLFGFGKHYGTVKFLSGKLSIVNEKIVGGTFIIDMQSIINTDGKYNEMLVDHLKNEDFFNVKKYPIAKLKITSASDINDSEDQYIKANLTIKEVTNEIEFKATLDLSKSTMTTQFIIDRTDWKITYESKGFAAIKNHAISDAIEFKVSLILK